MACAWPHRGESSLRRSDYLRLPVALHLELLAALPVGAHGRLALGRTVGLAAETTVGTASRGDTTELAVLVGRGADPVHARIAADSLVGWVHHDDLEVLVAGILVHPVRVEHTKVATPASTTLLGDAAKRATGLQRADTGVAGLTVHLALVDRALAATTADTHAVDADTLLGLVAEAAGLVRAGGLGGPVNGGHLAELPSADTLLETQNIGLLAVPHLAKVLVGSHGR